MVVCQRLRCVYYAQLSSEAPQRDVLFHCAVGLSQTGEDEDLDLSASILLSLLDSGYMRAECHLQLARVRAKQGFVVRARQSLQAALREEPGSEEALDFQRDFDAQVKRDGKVALYGAMMLTALTAIACALWSHRRGGRAQAATKSA